MIILGRQFLICSEVLEHPLLISNGRYLQCLPIS